MTKINTAPIKLKIELQNTPHPIIRKLLVPENINMLQLHSVLQLAMGWWGGHLFQFRDRKSYPSIIASFADDPEFFVEGEEEQAHKVKLKKDFLQLRESKPFWYWYDFGDDWWHQIKFQKPTRRDLLIFDMQEGAPVCVEAEGKCPPEDVGGVPGYEEFCLAINDSKHPEYLSFREWIGMDTKTIYNFREVDIYKTNDDLQAYFLGKKWKNNTSTIFREGLF